MLMLYSRRKGGRVQILFEPMNLRSYENSVSLSSCLASFSPESLVETFYFLHEVRVSSNLKVVEP